MRINPVIALAMTLAVGAAVALTALPDGPTASPVPAPVPTPTRAAAHDPVTSPRIVVADGLWGVGTEMAPGLWFAYPATGSCVWTVRADDTPEGFVSGGDATVARGSRAVYATVSVGQWFETVACGTWVKVGAR